MADMAEFEATPPGTVKRASLIEGWSDACVGDKLADNYESYNTHSNDYKVKIYANAGIWFGIVVEVYLDDIVGEVKYKISGDIWTRVEKPGSYNAAAVATGSSSSVSVVCSTRGVYRPSALE